MGTSGWWGTCPGGCRWESRCSQGWRLASAVCQSSHRCPRDRETRGESRIRAGRMGDEAGPLPGRACTLLSPGVKGQNPPGPRPPHLQLGRGMFSRAQWSLGTGTLCSGSRRQTPKCLLGHYLRVRGEGPQGLEAAGGKERRGEKERDSTWLKGAVTDWGPTLQPHCRS